MICTNCCSNLTGDAPSPVDGVHRPLTGSSRDGDVGALEAAVSVATVVPVMTSVAAVVLLPPQGTEDSAPDLDRGADRAVVAALVVAVLAAVASAAVTSSVAAVIGRSM